MLEAAVFSVLISEPTSLPETQFESCLERNKMFFVCLVFCVILGFFVGFFGLIDQMLNLRSAWSHGIAFSHGSHLGNLGSNLGSIFTSQLSTFAFLLSNCYIPS